MDIKEEKLKLIRWLSAQEDPDIIQAFVALKESNEQDWWDQISDKEKAEIEQGLGEADRNEVIPHEVVMAKYRDWLTK